MPDDQAGRPRAQGFGTRLSHAGRAGTRIHGFVNPPVMRGSTVLYPSCADRRALGAKRLDQALIYGVLGNPTHHALEDVVAEIEGGTRCQIVSSGLAACTTPLLAYLGAGDHLLVPDSVYGPTRTFCDGMLRLLAQLVDRFEFPPPSPLVGDQVPLYGFDAPDKPDRALMATPFSLGGSPTLGKSIDGFQIRTRGVPDNPLDVLVIDGLAQAALLGNYPATLPNGLRLEALELTGGTSLGRDDSDRWQWSTNYRLRWYRPSPHRF